MRTVKFINLSTGPLPFGNLIGSVFVTIWLAFMVFIVYCFRHVIYGGGRASKPWYQFRNIFWGAVAITLWYILLVIDRWLRYRGYTVDTHYILLQPLTEPFRVASSLLILSGTFNVIWRRKSHKQHWEWALTNKILFLAVGIVSFYYLLLFVAVAACWLDFTSLNTIMDIATRRNQFEVSSAALFVAYSLYIAIAAGHVCFYNSWKVDGRIRIRSKNFVLFCIAFLLFSRCAVDFGITAWAFGPTKTRQRVQVGQDIAYGAITATAMILMAGLARKLEPHDEGGGPERIIESNIRRKIIALLEEETEDGCKRPRALVEILQRIEGDLEYGTDGRDIFSGTALDDDEGNKVARDYLRFLGQKKGSRGPPRAAGDGDSSAIPTANDWQTFPGYELQHLAGAGSSTSSRTVTHHAFPVGSHTQQTRVPSAPNILGRGGAAAAVAVADAGGPFSSSSGTRTVSDGSRNPFHRHHPPVTESSSLYSAGAQRFAPLPSIHELNRHQMRRIPGSSPLSLGANGYTQ